MSELCSKCNRNLPIGALYCPYCGCGTNEDNRIALSKKERLSYALQFRILKNLSTSQSEKKDYENKIKILERGYAFHYDDLFDQLSEDEVSYDECSEVLDVLEMYSFIINSYKNLIEENKQGSLTEQDVTFYGFDGNSEFNHLSYVRYFLNDLGRYSEIKEFTTLSDNLNCHSSNCLARYKEMLENWKKFEEKRYNLTADQIKELTSIAPKWIG